MRHAAESIAAMGFVVMRGNGGVMFFRGRGEIRMRAGGHAALGCGAPGVLLFVIAGLDPVKLNRRLKDSGIFKRGKTFHDVSLFVVTPSGV